jgi:hypothetical protein
MATTQYLKSTSIVLGTTSAAWRAGSQGRAVTIGSLSNQLAIFSLLTCDTTIGTGTGSTASASTATGPTAGIPVTNKWLSAPLSADVTISGSIQFNICGSESSMNANVGWQVIVYRVDSTGALTQIINSEFGTEMGTGLAKQTWSATPTSTACKKGDRLLIIVLGNDAGGTMASGFTFQCQYGGSLANTADSSVVFNENFSFITSAPSGSTYYLRSDAHTISGGKKLLTTIGAAAATAIHGTVAGPCTYPGDLWTSTSGGADITGWFTPPLSAFTLGGVVSIKVQSGQVWEAGTGASPHDIIIAELAVCDSDGSNPVVWAATYLQPATAAGGGFYLSGADLSVADGKILRLRFYQADGSSIASAGTNRTINYNDSAASNKDVLLQFTQTITEGPSGPTGTSKISGGGGSFAVGSKGGQAIALVKGASASIAAGQKGGQSIAILRGNGESRASGIKQGLGRQLENLVSWSEDIESYTKHISSSVPDAHFYGGYFYGITTPSGTVTTPRGSETGFFTVQETATTGQHGYGKRINRRTNWISTGETVNYREYLDLTGHTKNWIRFEAYDGSKATSQTKRAWFNWTTKTWGTVDAGLTVSAKQDANGWWQFDLSWQAANDGGADYQYMDVAMSTADASTATYLGSTSDSWNTWGRQSWLGASTMPYVPTAQITRFGMQGAGNVRQTQTIGFSGTAIVSSTGRTISTGFKAAVGTARVSSSGRVYSAGIKEGQSAAIVRASGRTYSLGFKAATATALSRGSGRVMMTGVAAGFNFSGTATVSGSGRVYATGFKANTGNAIISGTGRTISLGAKAAASSAAVRGTGSAIASGSSARSSSARVSGTGRVYSIGAGHITANAIVSGSGRVIAVGFKSSGESSRISGEGRVVVVGSSARFSSSIVSGGGNINVSSIPFTATDAIVRGSGRVYATQGIKNAFGTARVRSSGRVISTASTEFPEIPEQPSVSCCNISGSTVVFGDCQIGSTVEFDDCACI